MSEDKEDRRARLKELFLQTTRHAQEAFGSNVDPLDLLAGRCADLDLACEVYRAERDALKASKAELEGALSTLADLLEDPDEFVEAMKRVEE